MEQLFIRVNGELQEYQQIDIFENKRNRMMCLVADAFCIVQQWAKQNPLPKLKALGNDTYYSIDQENLQVIDGIAYSIYKQVPDFNYRNEICRRIFNLCDNEWIKKLSLSIQLSESCSDKDLDAFYQMLLFEYNKAIEQLSKLDTPTASFENKEVVILN